MVSIIRYVRYMIVATVLMGVKTSLADRQTAQGVALATTGTGVGLLFEWIPDDVGKLAALIGALLSIVLIVVHLIISRIQYRRVELEIQIMLKKQAKQNDEGSGD